MDNCIYDIDGRNSRTGTTTAMASRRTALLLLGCFLSIGAPANAQTRRPMTFNDLMQMRRLGDIAVSPDGRWVMYGATDVDWPKTPKPRTSGSFRQPGAKPSGPHRLRRRRNQGPLLPRRHPDPLRKPPRRRPADLARRLQHRQPEPSANPHKLTSLAPKPTEPSGRPTASTSSYVSKVYPECSDDACNQQRDQDAGRLQGKSENFYQLLYRHWNAFTGDKRSHLFLVAPTAERPATSTPASTMTSRPSPSKAPTNTASRPTAKRSPSKRTSTPSPPSAPTSTSSPCASTIPREASKDLDQPRRRLHPPLFARWKIHSLPIQARAGYESDRFRLMLYDRQRNRSRSCCRGSIAGWTSSPGLLTPKTVLLHCRRAGMRAGLLEEMDVGYAATCSPTNIDE